MRIIVAGSRDFDDYDLLCEKMDRFVRRLDKGKTVILSGGAKGADRLGERWAYENGITVEVYRADWDKYGKAAGMIRNSEMVENASALVAFWDGESRGTADTISKAEQKGLQVRVVKFKKEKE